MAFSPQSFCWFWYPRCRPLHELQPREANALASALSLLPCTEPKGRGGILLNSPEGGAFLTLFQTTTIWKRKEKDLELQKSIDWYFFSLLVVRSLLKELHCVICTLMSFAQGFTLRYFMFVLIFSILSNPCSFILLCVFHLVKLTFCSLIQVKFSCPSQNMIKAVSGDEVFLRELWINVLNNLPLSNWGCQRFLW